MRVQLTLFDVTYKTFFGRTWYGPSKSTKRQGKSPLIYDENTYFHSSLHDGNILIVVEAVAVLQDDKKISCGWTALRPFSTDSPGTIQRFYYFFFSCLKHYYLLLLVLYH